MAPADDAPAGPPWSPYPVQDWSSLPEDPLARPMPTPHPSQHPSPHPTPRPVSRGWRGWRPVAVLTAIGLLLSVTCYAGLAVGTPGDDPALTFVPPDGWAEYARVESTRELRTTRSSEVTESARLTGVTALLSTDQTFGSRALAAQLADPERAQVWRTTTTPLDDQVATPQTTRLYRVASSVELLGETTPTEGFVYRPALVELPADVGPDQTWSSAGSAGDGLDYRSDFRSRSAPGGCLQTEGEVSYLTKTGARSRVVGVSRTWCPGRGLVASSASLADLRRTTRAIEAPPPTPDPTTASPPVRWRDPRAWTPKTYDTVSISPVFGQGPMNGTVSTAITPVVTASGLVVRALAAPTDLVATTPKSLQAWTSTWRAHPGGSILTLTAFGNVVVVTTSERRVVGYSDTGARLWEIELAELAPTAPVRVSPDHVALVDLSGEVRHIDLVTGAVDWLRKVGSDVSVAPAAGSGIVVVADRSQTLTALDAATGQPRWTMPLDAKGLVVAGDLVVAVQDQTAHAIAVDSGRHRWLRPYDGIFTRLAPLGGSVLLAAKGGSVLVGHDGAVQQHLNGYLDLTPTPDAVLGWGTERAEVVGGSGEVLTRFDIPDVSVVSAARPGLALDEGVLLFDLDWSFGAFTDE